MDYNNNINSAGLKNFINKHITITTRETSKAVGEGKVTSAISDINGGITLYYEDWGEIKIHKINPAKYKLEISSASYC